MNKLDLKEEIIRWKEQLPLAAGSTVWFIDSEGKLSETRIAEYVISDKVRFRLEKNSSYLTALSAFGRTVFLSKEEAELHLKLRAKK